MTAPSYLLSVSICWDPNTRYGKSVPTKPKAFASEEVESGKSSVSPSLYLTAMLLSIKIGNVWVIEAG